MNDSLSAFEGYIMLILVRLLLNICFDSYYCYSSKFVDIIPFLYILGIYVNKIKFSRN